MALTKSQQTLHEKVWEFVDKWGENSAGPWWEHRTHFELARHLDSVPEFNGTAPWPDSGTSTGESSKVVRPEFLKNWGNAHTARLGYDSKLPTNQLQPAGGKRKNIPDLYLLSQDGKTIEWMIEIKIWSSFSEKSNSQPITELEEDLTKWSHPNLPYCLVLCLVNVPRVFSKSNDPTPDKFLDYLSKGIFNSEALVKHVDGGGGVLIAVKQIDVEDGTSEVIKLWASKSAGKPTSTPLQHVLQSL